MPSVPEFNGGSFATIGDCRWEKSQSMRNTISRLDVKLCRRVVRINFSSEIALEQRCFANFCGAWHWGKKIKGIILTNEKNKIIFLLSFALRWWRLRRNGSRTPTGARRRHCKCLFLLFVSLFLLFIPSFFVDLFLMAFRLLSFCRFLI